MSQLKNENYFLTIKFLSGFFIVYWILFVVLDFIGNSNDIVNGFRYFKYTDFLICYFLLGSIIIYFIADKPKQLKPISLKHFRWVYSYVFLLMTMTLLMGFVLAKSDLGGSIVGFLGVTIKVHFSVLFLLVSAFSGGSFVLSKFKLNIDSGGIKQLISLALGLILMTLGLFLLGVFKILSAVYISLWFFVLLISGWKNVLEIFKLSIQKVKKPLELRPFTLILVLITILLIAINLIAIITPVPIGFDSLTLYMNIPKLMSDNNGLIQGYQPHYWSVLVSSGYSLFNSNVVAQYIGIIPGILSIFLVYYLAKLFVNRDWAIFSAICFYSIPVILWQSSYEIKTDLGMLFFSLLAILLVFINYYKKESNEVTGANDDFGKNSNSTLWLLTGIFLGFALGIKFTTLIPVFSLLIVVFYQFGGKFIAMGSFFLSLSIIFILKLYTFSNLQFSGSERNTLSVLLLLTALGLFIWGILKTKEKVLPSLKISGKVAIMIVVLIMPWAIKNTFEHGNISFSSIISGKDPAPLLIGENKFKEDNNYGPKLMRHWQNSSFKSEAASAQLINDKKITGKHEEINRYLGYEGGFHRFSSLPYDLTMKKNVNLFSTDIGLLFLAFLPLLFFLSAKSKWIFILRSSFMMIWLSLSLHSVYNAQSLLSGSDVLEIIRNLEFGTGSGLSVFLSQLHYLLIIPLIYLGQILSPLFQILTHNTDFTSILYVILFVVILFFLSRGFIKNHNKFEKSLYLFSGVYFFLWLILSSGIPWYGIAGLAILPIFMSKFILSDKQEFPTNNSFYQYAFGGVIFIWFLLLIPYKLSPLAQVKVSDASTLNYNYLMNQPTLLFACNEISAADSKNAYLNLQTAKMMRILNSDKEAVVLNIGSMMRYYIENNNVRLIDDNQLDFFNTIWESSNKTKIATTNRLKQLDVRYILLDLGVHTMDNTADASLRRKVEEFIIFIYQNPNVELLATDRLVIHPKGQQQMEFNGSIVTVKNDIFGNGIIENGKLALFQIR